MHCSIIIPTIGRETLKRSVESVLNQQVDENNYEIIVVNDSGEPLKKAAWQKEPSVRIINTQRRDKSVAKNVGAATSRGEYLQFLDDDDWLMPHSLDCLYQASKSDDSIVIFGSTALVNRQGDPIIELHHDMSKNCLVQTMAGEWIPNGSCWISTEAFFSIGGYNPNMSVGEDSDLCRRLALYGDFMRIESLVLTVSVGQEGSTTDYEQLSSQSRQARERILDNPGVQKRMLDSANSPYWHGRIARVYLTSAVWNILHRKFFTSISRLINGIIGILFSGRHMISRQFWSAVMKPYESFTYSQGFRTVNQKSN